VSVLIISSRVKGSVGLFGTRGAFKSVAGLPSIHFLFSANDHGADVLSFHQGEVWIVQVKHTAKEILVGSLAMSDLMAARMSYSTPLLYSVRLMAVTNGNFSRETQNEGSQNGIRLLDRRELMSQLRTSSLTMGRIYTRESDRCKSFDEGIRSAKKWF
jgi:hypothetical protein